MSSGIDVSKWQGTIDWKSVKGSGVTFAILRAGYGRKTTQKDACFEYNYTNARKNGIAVGAYWYSYATTTEQAKEEAETFLTVIKGKSFDFPLFFDQEYEPGILALTSEKRTELCNTFIKAVQAAGYNCGLYSSENFYNTKQIGSQLVDCPLWIAKYSKNKPNIGKTVDIWQYTSQGKISGITGNVDCNYCYSTFEASKATEDTTETVKEEVTMTNAEVQALIAKTVNEQLASLTDITGTGDNPASWAKEATEKCKALGLFEGDGNGNYGWQKPVTREQLAVIFSRFYSED